MTDATNTPKTADDLIWLDEPAQEAQFGPEFVKDYAEYRKQCAEGWKALQERVTAAYSLPDGNVLEVYKGKRPPTSIGLKIVKAAEAKAKRAKAEKKDIAATLASFGVTLVRKGESLASAGVATVNPNQLRKPGRR